MFSWYFQVITDQFKHPYDSHAQINLRVRITTRTPFCSRKGVCGVRYSLKQCSTAQCILHVASISCLIVAFCFSFVENTYTVEEVIDMLDGLQTVVRGEVESELINTAHTNVLLLRQVFSQAEKWYLNLQADISELENR